MSITMQAPPSVNGRGTHALAQHFEVIQSGIRRELMFAEAAGIIRCARVGRCRVLPDDQLPAFSEWLAKRGLICSEPTV